MRRRAAAHPAGGVDDHGDQVGEARVGIAEDLRAGLDDERMGAVSADSAWAVGSLVTSGSAASSLIEHFNGTAWAEVPASGASGELSGIAALSHTDAWAAEITTGSQALAMHWNGTAWQTVPAANPGSDSFSPVAGTPPGQPLWAAGNMSQTATLVETTTG